MSLVAEVFDYVVGVDTHAERHSFAVVGSVGKVVDSAEFPTTEAGFRRALSWIQRRTPGRRVIAVECIGSYDLPWLSSLPLRGSLS